MSQRRTRGDTAPCRAFHGPVYYNIIYRTMKSPYCIILWYNTIVIWYHSVGQKLHPKPCCIDSRSGSCTHSHSAENAKKVCVILFLITAVMTSTRSEVSACQNFTFRLRLRHHFLKFLDILELSRSIYERVHWYTDWWIVCQIPSRNDKQKTGKMMKI